MAGFRAELERHWRAPVKAVILNQSVVAGVGNIYADESLHLTRIHPARQAGSLDAAEVRRLHGAIREIVELAIESGGTSFPDYADPTRAPTGYLARAARVPPAGAALPSLRDSDRAHPRGRSRHQDLPALPTALHWPSWPDRR